MNRFGKACAGCRFFDPAANSIDGDCRRRAPSPDRAANNVSAFWPRVGRADWCGEFQSLEMRLCEVCKVPIDVSLGMSRADRRYCSHKCRTAAHRAAGERGRRA